METVFIQNYKINMTKRISVIKYEGFGHKLYGVILNSFIYNPIVNQNPQYRAVSVPGLSALASKAGSSNDSRN